jgi:hypothetical protein
MRRILLAAACGSPWLSALAHHPGDPTEALHWWELVVAGAIAVFALFLVGRIRRRRARRRGRVQE